MQDDKDDQSSCNLNDRETAMTETNQEIMDIGRFHAEIYIFPLSFLLHMMVFSCSDIYWMNVNEYGVDA